MRSTGDFRADSVGDILMGILTADVGFVIADVWSSSSSSNPSSVGAYGRSCCVVFLYALPQHSSLLSWTLQASSRLDRRHLVQDRCYEVLECLVGSNRSPT